MGDEPAVLPNLLQLKIINNCSIHEAGCLSSPRLLLKACMTPGEYCSSACVGKVRKLIVTSVQECHRNKITGMSYPATLSQDYICCLKMILYNARKLVGIN